MRKSVLEGIEKEKIIVIVRGIERKNLLPLAEAMYDGGIRFLEVTFSADGSVSDEETAGNIEMLAKSFDGRMYIGAGTVLRVNQVELAYSAGSKFIISPDTYPEVIQKTRELNMVSMPGAITPGEIQTACRAGADFVKLFPIANMGIEYFKALRAPLSHVKFIAVGGINEKNMPDYLAAGAVGFGIGSNIVDKKSINAGDFGAIRNLAKRYTAALK